MDEHGQDSRPGPAVYLHVGLPKSGTSYLQQVLWASRDSLRAAGVLVPGQRRNSQTMAVWDIMGRRPRGADLPQVAGSWSALAQAVRDWTGSRAVVSEEFLALANRAQVRRVVRSFEGAPVHVVVTVRDLARVIGGTWQQNLQKGHAWSWDKFVHAVRDPEQGKASIGAVFWLRQDVIRVLDTWETAVPRERIRVVTVPPAGSPPQLLLERFATACGLDPALLDADQPDGNTSVGVAEAEVLRRLNAGLGGRLNERQYRRAVMLAVKPALSTPRVSSRRITLPREHHGWVTERATEFVAELRSRRYAVAGDLEDLIPAFPTPADRPDDVPADAVAEAALAALTAVTEQYARYWWRTRRRDEATEAGGGSKLASMARAGGYRARMLGLSLAEHNRLVDRVAARYLHRSRSTR